MAVSIIGTDTQRNGVGGEPFVAVRFTLDEYDRPLIAVVPLKFRAQNDPELPDRTADGWSETYVVDPADLSQHWRGDELYRQLLEAGLWERVQDDQRAGDALNFTPEQMKRLYPTKSEEIT